METKIVWRDPKQEVPKRPYMFVLITAPEFEEEGGVGWTQGIMDSSGDWYYIQQLGKGTYSVVDTIEPTAWAYVDVPQSFAFPVQNLEP